MDTIVLVPSFWVLPYLIGMGIGFYFMSNVKNNLGIVFTLTISYLLALTIGLRLYYGS